MTINDQDGTVYQASCYECMRAYGPPDIIDTTCTTRNGIRRFYCFASGENGEEIAAAAERHHSDTGHLVRFIRIDQKMFGESPPFEAEQVRAVESAPRRRWSLRKANA